MSNPSFKLDDNAPTVSWAESRSGGEGDSSASQVKALYIKNLPRDITQERLKALFEHHGKILKVVIPPAKPGKEDSRYGFVHYAERTSVMRALKNTERYEIDVPWCSWWIWSFCLFTTINACGRSRSWWNVDDANHVT
ncbi:unnamed protein product [Arabidopsis thaliana]|uniref:(thale cress) hypothetical protein n=1 Tax=Arabidopsis thaliana TaxID=3702 RepID=A0A7G2FES8_ARATH|nr:unnamed protein product [Arabidopsis thaliana]